MIEFHTITLEDKAWIDRHVFCEDSPSADYNFGNMFIWDGHYRQLVCCWGDRTLTKVRLHGEPAFVYPIGCGPLGPAIEALREFAAFKGYPFLHGKKNHCNRFEAEHSWSFVPLTREQIPGCQAMLEQWTADNSERLDESIVYEHEAIECAFQNYEALGLEGGVLYADGQLLGFTFGEMTSQDTFDTHVEKAAADVNGAYPMVCRELARMLRERHPELRYINREDDMGLESLRASKQSYKPLYLLKKYTAEWNDDGLNPS